MSTFIATFGMGWTLRNNFVEVEAEDEGQARKIMFNVYGQGWAFLYKSHEAAGVNQFNLNKVPFGTPNTRL